MRVSGLILLLLWHNGFLTRYCAVTIQSLTGSGHSVELQIVSENIAGYPNTKTAIQNSFDPQSPEVPLTTIAENCYHNFSTSVAINHMNTWQSGKYYNRHNRVFKSIQRDKQSWPFYIFVLPLRTLSVHRNFNTVFRHQKSANSFGKMYFSFIFIWDIQQTLFRFSLPYAFLYDISFYLSETRDFATHHVNIQESFL